MVVTTDKLKIGDRLEPLHVEMSPELNAQMLESLCCEEPLYKEVIHPAILVGFSNVTRSPSYNLEPDVAAVHTHDEIEFLNQGKVGEKLVITWVCVSIYMRKNRYWKNVPYQVVEAEVRRDSNQDLIIRRRMCDIYLRKQYLQW